MVKKILALAAFCVVARCASAPVNSERLGATEAPIRAAEEMGAAKVPQAALELKLAHEQTERAKQFMKDGEKDRADMLLLRAQADAELALALAKEAPLVAEAKSASEEVKALQQRNQQSN
jgi:hypothetical protein